MKLCIQIYDKTKKDHYELMGSAYFDVGLVLGSPGQCRAKKLNQGGMIIASIRKGAGSGELRLKLKGVGLKNVDG